MNERAEQHSITDDTADRIMNLIVEENLDPGDKLPTEFELMQKLGVGRSTLREAIRRLCSRNVLETRRGSGIYVSSKRGVPEDPLGLTFLAKEGIDAHKLAIELSDVRVMIEPEIAFLAAVNITDEQKEKLLALCAETEEVIRRGEDYTQVDMQLHSFIAECSGNHVLNNLIPIIRSAINIAIVTDGQSHRGGTIEQHRAVVDAIVSNNAQEARLAMISHLYHARQAYVSRYGSKQKV